MDIEKKRARITRIAAVNGWSVAVLGALCLLCSLLWFTVVGILIGLALLTSGCMELSGRRRLKQYRPGARRRLAGSQLLALSAIVLYCAYNLLLVDPVLEIEKSVIDLPPDQRMQISQALQQPEVQEWVPKGFRYFYLALIAGTVLYQGGLYLYYTLATRKLDRAAAAESQGKVPAQPLRVADELQKLAQLMKEGALTTEEWTRAKELYLGKPENKRAQTIETLRELHELRVSGALSVMEFNMKKWDLLSRRG